MTRPVDTLLWVAVPYTCLAIFVVGHYWRYRYDKFGWTTRSSQLYERRLLRWGSPLFHFGIVAVLLGHVVGLGVPERWTDDVGISDSLYHFVAVVSGGLAGFAAVAGLLILIYRRRTVGPVFSATTRMDKLMYVVLGAVIILGMVNTVVANMFGHYDYRTGVSIWFRGIFRLDLHPDLMSQAPIGFQLHALAAFLLFALWPFTRLVHAFSALIGYLWRPYVVYRSKDEKLGSVAQLFVLAPVDDVGPPQVPDERAECVHEPGEGPEGEQQERRERVQLEPDRRLAHEVWVQVEAEDAAEPDRDACSVVIVTKHVRHNSVDHAEDDHGPEHDVHQLVHAGRCAENWPDGASAVDQDEQASDGGESGEAARNDRDEMVERVRYADVVRPSLGNTQADDVTQ